VYRGNEQRRELGTARARRDSVELIAELCTDGYRGDGVSSLLSIGHTRNFWHACGMRVARVRLCSVSVARCRSLDGTTCLRILRGLTDSRAKDTGSAAVVIDRSHVYALSVVGAAHEHAGYTQCSCAGTMSVRGGEQAERSRGLRGQLRESELAPTQRAVRIRAICTRSALVMVDR